MAVSAFFMCVPSRNLEEAAQPEGPVRTEYASRWLAW